MTRGNDFNAQNTHTRRDRKAVIREKGVVKEEYLRGSQETNRESIERVSLRAIRGYRDSLISHHIIGIAIILGQGYTVMCNLLL